MKKLFQIIISFLLVLTLSACNTKQEDDVLRIICPSGAPSLSMVSVYDDVLEDGGTIEFVEGSDMLVAELTKKQHDYNIIIAPVNLGTKLIQAKQCDYKLAGILTWGNLYIVGSDESVLKESGEIALFGEGAVPQMIYNSINLDTTLTPVYYSNAPLVQQQLLSNKAKAAMLAEPLASATIAKAKQNNIDLKIIKDMQALYGENGYPQAAIFVEEGINCNELFEDLNEFTNQGYDDLEEDLNKIGVDVLGLPQAPIVVSSIERQNLHFKKIGECKEEVKDFLKKYNIELSDDMIIE